MLSEADEAGLRKDLEICYSICRDLGYGQGEIDREGPGPILNREIDRLQKSQETLMAQWKKDIAIKNALKQELADITKLQKNG